MSSPLSFTGSRWLYAVGTRDETSLIPILALQPATGEQHEHVRIRFQRADFKAVNRDDWETGRYPHSVTSTVEVHRIHVRRITIGRTTLHVGDNVQVSPMWANAAAEARVAVLCLLPPGTFGDEHGAEHLMPVTNELAAHRKLWACTLQIRHLR